MYSCYRLGYLLTLVLVRHYSFREGVIRYLTLTYPPVDSEGGRRWCVRSIPVVWCVIGPARERMKKLAAVLAVM